MRIQYKIFLLISLVTAGFGALLVMVFNDPIAMMRFRALFSDNPLRNFSGLESSFGTNPAALWYGIVGISALVVTGFLIRFISNAELQAFRDRLIATEVKKAELETELQDALWKERQARLSAVQA